MVMPVDGRQGRGGGSTVLSSAGGAPSSYIGQSSSSAATGGGGGRVGDFDGGGGVAQESGSPMSCSTQQQAEVEDVLIEVVDFGVGLDPQQQSMLFRPFSQPVRNRGGGHCSDGCRSGFISVNAAALEGHLLLLRLSPPSENTSCASCFSCVPAQTQTRARSSGTGLGLVISKVSRLTRTAHRSPIFRHTCPRSGHYAWSGLLLLADWPRC